jgi:hypothetical protein
MEWESKAVAARTPQARGRQRKHLRELRQTPLGISRFQARLGCLRARTLLARAQQAEAAGDFVDASPPCGAPSGNVHLERRRASAAVRDG